MWYPDGGAQEGEGGFGTLMVVFRMVVVVMDVVPRCWLWLWCNHGGYSCGTPIMVLTRVTVVVVQL